MDIRRSDSLTFALSVEYRKAEGWCLKGAERMRKMSRGHTSLRDKGQILSTSRLRMQVTTNSKGYLELNLNGRELRAVPAETFQLTATQVLRLAYNHIDYLPLMISYLRALKVLDLQHNLLVHLPETLVNCRHLAELNLTANRLSSFPKAIGGLKQLKILSVGENQFERLPEEVGLLTCLRVLDIHGNKLWHLPFSLQELRHLYNLNASDNMFDNVPLVITKITSLQKLNLSRNRLATLPVNFDALKNLRELNLSHNSFMSISSLLVALKNLRYLSLDNNRLKFLPPQMSRLQHLHVLHLQHNDLSRVPCRLDSVQYYNVASNQLTSFSVGGMRGLVSLTASCNNLETVPQGLYKLRKLKFLYLDNNRLMQLDDEVGLLQQLRVLDISNNKLISLPNSLYRLARLQSFNVKGNYNLKQTGIKSDSQDRCKLDVPGLKKEGKYKVNLMNAENETEHETDPFRSIEDKGENEVKVAKSCLVHDKSNDINKIKSGKTTADIPSLKYGHCNSVKTLLDLKEPTKVEGYYLQHQNSHKSIGFLDSASESTMRNKQSIFRKSSLSERDKQIQVKRNFSKGFMDLFRRRYKSPNRKDAMEMGYCSAKKSFKFPDSTQADQVRRSNSEEKKFPRNSEIARISLIRRKEGKLDNANDGSEKISSVYRSPTSNSIQFNTQSQGKQIDESSNSDSFGYGSWRSRGHSQVHDVDNIFYSDRDKYANFNENNQVYQDNDAFEHTRRYHYSSLKGQNNSFCSKESASGIPLHLHEGQSQCRYQKCPTNSDTKKLYSAKTYSEFIGNRHTGYKSTNTDVNNRDRWRVRNSESDEERSTIYSEFNSSKSGHRQIQENGFFKCETSWAENANRKGQYNHEHTDSMTKLPYETNFQNVCFQRNTSKQRNSENTSWPFSAQNENIPRYPIRSCYHITPENSSAATTYGEKIKTRSFSECGRERWDRFCPRNQSICQSNEFHNSQRPCRCKINPEIIMKSNPGIKGDLHSDDDVSSGKTRKHHTRSMPEPREDALFKNGQPYHEFNHVLSTKAIPINENQLSGNDYNTFYIQNNSHNENLYSISEYRNKNSENVINRGLIRSRSADSLDPGTRCISCYHHVRDVKCSRCNRRDRLTPSTPDRARTGSESDVANRERGDHGMTDFSLLGVCNQVETLLSKDLPQFTELGNHRKSADGARGGQSLNPSTVNRNTQEEVVSPDLVYSRPQIFTLTREGGLFVSKDRSKVEVTVSALAVPRSINITVRLLTISPTVISKAKELNYFIENILAIGPVVFFETKDVLKLNSPASITIPAPNDVKGGHFIVLTVRKDNSCIPCSDGYRSRKMAATFTTWHFSGKVALITQARCKYKACKSVELLLRCIGIKQV